jgi:DNA-binding transcriptional LysR family regulator
MIETHGTRYPRTLMSIELRTLRHAMALAEQGNFARAARAVHLTQPALSRSIQSLEQRLGAALFDRRRDGVVPTDVGRVLLERARELLALAEDLDQEIVRNRTLQTGRVVAGGGPYPADSLLAPAAARLVQEFPQVAIELRVRNWDELLRQLRARELDFFVAETSTLEADADLDVRLLHAHALHFVGRADHPLRRAARAPTVPELLAYPLVAQSRIPPRVLEPLLAAQRRTRLLSVVARAFPSIQCHSLAAVLRIVETSDAVTALPLSAARQGLRDGRLALLGSAPWLSLRYGLVRLRGRTPTRAAEAFVERVLATETQVVAEERALHEEWVQPAARGARSRRTRAGAAA